MESAASRIRKSARHHLREPVIGLRAEHDIDKGRAPPDLFALGLRNAAGHRDEHAPALALPRALQAADAAELGKDLLRRLLADVAGIGGDQMRAPLRPPPAISRRRP